MRQAADVMHKKVAAFNAHDADTVRVPEVRGDEISGPLFSPWALWESLGGGLTSDLVVGQNADGRMQAFRYKL